jgi:hypothetical protein
LNSHGSSAAYLVLAASLAACAPFLQETLRSSAYAPEAEASDDTLRVRLAETADETDVAGSAARALGAVVPGYLSARGLPPIEGQFTLTDTGLVFRSVAGVVARFPLVGPVRQTGGRRWRPSSVSLAYIDEASSGSVYVFRLDAGVFETDRPGVLLDVASHPGWLDSLAPSEWVVDRPLVSPRDSFALRAAARQITTSSYADSLYTLFGSPRAAVGLIGLRGQRAGRLGEYIGRRDSLALDPGRISSEAQLRHTLAHELGHRWQARAPGQLAALWREIASIRDPHRYGYGVPSEHQAEAIAFAVGFLQTTARGNQLPATSLRLLDHYELLVPGTRTMVRYLALQPIYRNHPLRSDLTTGAR